MDQWPQYDSGGGGRRYTGNAQASQQHLSRHFLSPNKIVQPPAGFTYEQYQGGMSSNPQSLAASPAATPNMRDGNGDVAMQDALDPYSGMKYPMRPHHQHHLSSSRVSSHPEQSAAAQRYSPMEALSPTTPYGTSPQIPQNPYTSQAAINRQSPSRPGSYSSSRTYYDNRLQSQQLPPITPYASNNDSYPSSAVSQLNAAFGNDPKSPRRALPTNGGSGRGPVPEFVKVKSEADLRPNVNTQPAFRRANPEGGFISVSSLSFPICH